MSFHQIDDCLFTDIFKTNDLKCFYCNKSIQKEGQPTFVGWQGTPSMDGEFGFIVLHQGCAEEFAIHLIRDATLAKLKNAKVTDLVQSEPHVNHRQNILDASGKKNIREHIMELDLDDYEDEDEDDDWDDDYDEDEDESFWWGDDDDDSEE